MTRSLALRRFITFLGLGAIVLVLGSRELTLLLTEFWWYRALGHPEVLQTVLFWKAIAGLATFAIFATFLGLNYAIAQHIVPPPSIRITTGTQWRLSRRSLPHGAAPLIIALISAAAAVISAGSWRTVAEFWHAAPFGRIDAIFGLDLSFFVMRLPFLEGVFSGALVLTLMALLGVGLLYGISGAIDFRRGWRQFVYGSAKTHLSVLAALAIASIAIGFWLERYNLLYSTAGTVYGAGYTDVRARLLALSVLAVVSAALAGTFVGTAGRSSFVVPLCGAGVYLAAYILLLLIYPILQQETVVAPNELEKEQPYIERNLAATLQGYGLENVQRQPFDVRNTLDGAAIATNQATIDNIRLWDDKPLLATYQQIQEFRPYYRFQDTDIDRYALGEDYRQVLLSARENAWSGQQRDQTWLNQHFYYTHGYGIAMSPANRVTPQGLPELFVKDIPPSAVHPALEISQPGIYYGEYARPDQSGRLRPDRSYVFTGAGVDELDYPATVESGSGERTVETRYNGLGGVPMPGFGQRLAYAYVFNDRNILLSSYFLPETRIHYHRDVRQRVRRLAPFLQFDSDPYLVVIDGTLKWIVDAYTLSDRLPYSEPIIGFSRRFNYIRNSVKAVVDAYDGAVTFYAIDTEDPILQVYRNLFPNLFADDVPPALRAHFRYPLDLFRAQAQVYLRYHMGDARSFYYQEDLWSFPNKIVKNGDSTPQEVPIEPYYAIVRLPGGDRAEFTTILPFTPAGKLPMVAWLAARSDGENYGKLLLYEFPKQERIFGPQQIEARIDQNTEISQQLTLWDQQGSEVVRGNILVIPLEESLLYIEPIYLKAESQGLPELKRVIVAYGDEVAMETTLEAALARVLGAPVGPPAGTSGVAELVGRAQAAFEAARRAAESGDWAIYGVRLQELEDLLQQLSRESAGR